MAARGRQRSVWGDESGDEQLSYVFIVASVVVPLVVVVWMLWSILLYYFQLEAFLVDFPLF
jgi:hypothetical protein